MFFGVHFTPRQQLIISQLSDGGYHPAVTMYESELGRSELAALQVHISELRKKLNPRGYDILCVIRNRRKGYQLVRLISQEDHELPDELLY